MRCGDRIDIVEMRVDQFSTKCLWILALVSVITITGVSSQAIRCPLECSCSEIEAHCRRLPVTRLSQLPKTIKLLVLLHTDFTNFNKNVFSQFVNLERLELAYNKITQLPVDAFDNLAALTHLRIDKNAIHCDCSTLDLIQRLESKKIRAQIVCDTPSQVRGKNVQQINEQDLNCEMVQDEIAEDMTALKTSDGNSMFVCHVDDNINLEEFETENGDADEISVATLGIQNFAAMIFGEHHCVFERSLPGLNDDRVTLVVTTEANGHTGISVNTEFKAELHVRDAISNSARVNDRVHIHCPKSGKFVCQGENQSGRPTFLNEPFDIDAFEGTTIELPCQGEGEPTPEVKWKKDGKSLIQTAKHRIATSGSLFIKKITIQEAGRYECTIRNNFGRISASAVITVKNKDIISPNEQIVRVAFSDAARDVDKAINQTVAYLFDPSPNRPKHHGELFKIVRYPKGNARELARAAEVYERTLLNIRKQIDGGATLNANLTDFNYKDILSAEHLDLIAQLSGCMAHRIIPNCTNNMCFHLKYRSLDGTCNNLEHPSWGASLTGFRRIAKPIYENGFSTPIGWNKDKLYFGFPKPSARLVSTSVISTNTITQDDRITHMVMQWGQFLDHDLDHAIPAVSSESWDGTDCKKTCENTAPCYPIPVPPNDPRVKNRRCIDLFRSSAICGSGMTSILFDTVQPREQINQLTAYIDASQVYGFSSEFARDLRNLTSNDGLLRTGVNFPNQKSMLPFTSPTDGVDCRRDVEESKVNCFAAGDIRVNEQIGLTAMHTIWLREHNRIASELKEINFHWDGETLYQEARKVIGAEMQLITYEHWLPIILGAEGMEMLGPYKGYDPTVQATISNEFATAALRFGHTLINPILHRLNETFEPIQQGHLELHRAFFAPWRLVYEGGVDPLMRGMYSVPAKLKLPTQNLNTELTEKLFFNAHAVALDLAAINIQRARDHGIPGYNEYRAKCKMSVAETFDDLRGEISDANVRAKLKELYGHPSNIDLFVGGILEDQIAGGKIGPLFRCILIEQFQRLRSGDRHWYENPSSFRPEQLSQIKMASLGRVLCDNGDNITRITDNVFFLPGTQGGYKRCSEIPKINFAVWLNCDKCSAHQDPNIVHIDPTLPRQRRSVPRSKREIKDEDSFNEVDAIGTNQNETNTCATSDQLSAERYEEIQNLQLMLDSLVKSAAELQERITLLEARRESQQTESSK